MTTLTSLLRVGFSRPRSHDEPPIALVPPGDHLSLHAAAIQQGVAADGLTVRTPHEHDVPDELEPPTGVDNSHEQPLLIDEFQLEGESFFHDENAFGEKYEAMTQAGNDGPFDEDELLCASCVVDVDQPASRRREVPTCPIRALRHAAVTGWLWTTRRHGGPG